MMKNYKLDGAGLFSKDYNEIYTVLNKMRNNNKFDYVCSDTENDPKFLNLDCIQGKLLKYILQINLKVKKEQQKNFIVKNELQTKELSMYLSYIKQGVTDLINDLDKNIDEKSKSKIEGEKSKLSGGYDDYGYDENITDNMASSAADVAGIVVLGAVGAPLIAVAVGFFLIYIICRILISILLTPFYFGYGGKNAVEELWSTDDLPDRPKFGGALNNNKTNKMSLKELNQMKSIISFIKLIIIDIEKKIPANNIQITNVCINGTSVKGQKKHVKCKKNDYKSQSKIDMSVIKKIFKSMDFKLDKMSDLSNIENVKKELEKVPDEKNIEAEETDDSESK
jgi:hypothetical protein